MTRLLGFSELQPERKTMVEIRFKDLASMLEYCSIGNDSGQRKIFNENNGLLALDFTEIKIILSYAWKNVVVEKGFLRFRIEMPAPTEGFRLFDMPLEKISSVVERETIEHVIYAQLR